MKVYLNGQFVPEEEAKVSVFDHGLLYGDGVFEGIRAYDGYVFKLDRHLDRLYDSAKAISLDIPLSKSEMTQAILETLRVNKLRSAYIRPVVTRGPGDLGIDPRRCFGKPSVIIIVKEWKSLYGEEISKRGLKAIVASTRARPPDTLSPSIKSLNYLNNIMARIEANHAGADEAIMLDTHGFVAEGTADNIFIVKRGQLLTPPTVACLPGITRETVIELAQQEKIPVREEFFTLSALYSADECFVTGTAAEIAPIIEIDHRPVGTGAPGPITQKLIQRFRAITGIPQTGTPIYE
ncbi:MAG: branched-chain-amino-acid transaminase [Candidatus Bipolaricaulota bacterium]|nr:branched-chain-amino-acid transaminase [Candidatus Bipolaricaulota bacterium]MCS7274163.1 branched-chain-amino-acid transaminase [Candidatus Bipolaricaulota bacterium]MDW8111424.1 branched-chain-amino-acid transaminase [Candidatus Bipolaricaulota bacterium]MDW8329938.1 branched-chain-amino-acid transaminase [Candidatus Bipolaricaulota bacterium]